MAWSPRRDRTRAYRVGSVVYVCSPSSVYLHTKAPYQSPGGIRTTDGKNQRPLDIAREKGHKHLYAILSIDLLPQVSDDELAEVERHFHAVILEEARGVFKLESMQLPQLGMLRDKPRITMQIPGMYGVRRRICHGSHFYFDLTLHIHLSGLHFLVGGGTLGLTVLLSSGRRIWQDKSHHSQQS